MPLLLLISCLIVSANAVELSSVRLDIYTSAIISAIFSGVGWHMKFLTCLLILFFLFVGFSPLQAAGQRPKIGLVLGGGGAAGVAHVGVLKVLEEQGIPIDVIAGTSMGAIVGSLYAAGYKADELEQVVKGLDWPALFQDGKSRDAQTFQQKRQNTGFFSSFEVGVKEGSLKLPEGLVSGQKLIFELRRLLGRVSQVEDFDRLPIPFRAVATDIETGEAVVLGKGNLASAVRASMSIPGLFASVTLGGRVLVDGFVSNNVPVDVARQMGADIVIVVSIPYYFEKRDKLDSVLAVSFQAMQFLTAKNSLPQLEGLKSPNVVLEPDLKEIGSLSFDKVEQTIPIGEAAARAKLAALQQIAALAPKSVGGKSVSMTRQASSANSRIAQVVLQNESRLTDEVILGKLGIKAGDVLDIDALQQGLDNIHALGYFDLVDYQLETSAAGEQTLTVITRERSTGDNRLRFGFSLEDDFEGDSRYQLGVRHVVKGVTDTGGEWRNSAVIGNRLHLESELFQPLDASQNEFGRLQLWHDRQDLFGYDGEVRVAEVRLGETAVQLGWGKGVGQNAEVRASGAYRRLSPDTKTGQPGFSTDNFQVAELQFSYSFDTLDDVDFPGRGQWLRANYTHGFKVLGADLEFDRLRLSAGAAYTQDQHRVILRAEAGSTFADDAHPVEQLTLGGLGRLSGLPQDQLRGNHMALASGAYLYEIKELASFAKVYAGGSLEYGNAWERGADVNWGNLLWSGSLFVGVDSPIGPAFVGVGQTEGRDSALFLQVGRRF